MTDILDKIMGSVDKYIVAAGIVAGEFAETAKIKADMYGIKKKRDQALMEIGEAVYRMYLKDSFDMNRVAEKCRYVSNLDGEIKAKEHEAKEIHKSSGKHRSRKHRKHYKEPEKEQHNSEQQSNENQIDNNHVVDAEQIEIDL